MNLYSSDLQFYKLKKDNATSFPETFTRLIKDTIKNHRTREKKDTDENKHKKGVLTVHLLFLNIY